MISLFIDTTCQNLSVALLENNKLLTTKTINNPKEHSTYALSTIEGVLKECSFLPKDIDKIYVVNGPGSFTGTRIGVTIAKTYAWVLNKEIVTLSSLETIASTMALTNYDYIVPLIDARRGNVFGAIYDKNLNVIYKDTFLSLNDIISKTQEYSNVCFVSSDQFDGLQIVKTNINVSFLISKHCEDRTLSPHLVNPNYLKSTEAEEQLKERENND